MLPGFRFLFAAIMLSMSLLVFGLGAASLLRAAHQSFASNSPWRTAPEVPFAQRVDSLPPMLATLRVDPPAMEKATTFAAEPAPANTEPAGGEQMAALNPQDAPMAEAAAMPAADNVPLFEAAPPVADTTTAPDETRMAVAVASDTSPAGSEPAAAPSEPAMATPATTGATTSAETGATATKIATLGGPAVDVTADKPVKKRSGKADTAKSDESAIKKQVHARRAAHRRRLTARARLAAQQLQPQQANPFAPPPAPAAPATRQPRQ
jgi:hypothetical protein